MIFKYLLIFRLCMAILVFGNYDYPDEYWQGPEVAHKIVYGFGYLTWEWTMGQPIRSPIYQLYLSIAYLFLQKCEIKSDLFVQYAPWIWNSLIAAVTDYSLIKILKKYYGKVEFLPVIAILSNWFYVTLVSRTLINSLEVCLSILAFYLWLKSKDFLSRVVVGLCYLARPTSLILWAVVWPYQLLFCSKNKIQFIFKNFLQIILMLLTSFVISYLYFNKWQLTEWNFVKYNVIMKWSSFYGQHSYFSYFVCFLPIMLGVSLPFFIYSVVNIATNVMKNTQLAKLLVYFAVTTCILSFSVHKEMRFIIVQLVFSLVLSYFAISKLPKKMLVLIIFFNIFCVFLSLGKTGGTEAIRKIKSQINHQDINVIFMGQPHIIPLYCILHRNINVAIPDSSPMKKIKQEDEVQLLKENSSKIYEILIQKLSYAQPDYILVQSTYEQYVIKLLDELNFKVQNSYRHCSNFQFIVNYFNKSILCDYISIYTKA